MLSTDTRPDVTSSETVTLPTKFARVLHLINGEHYAGAERVQDLLALRLPEFGFQASFACLKPRRFPELRTSQRVECTSAEMAFRGDLRPVLRIASQLRHGGYSLLHTHTPRTAMIGRMAAALAGVPLVHHVHSPTSVDSERRLRNSVNAMIERRSVKSVAAAICVSQTLGHYARGLGIHPARIHVVPNGVAVVGPLSARTAPTKCWTLGAVALFRPRKGLEVLLESLAELRRAGHDVRLRAVGTFETPGYEKSIRIKAEQLGLAEFIEWAGFSRDVHRELSQMDLLVLPSLYGEGLPMVILEAMAAGVPVIATRVEGVPEAIRDRIDGVLANPNDPKSLTQAVEQVIRGEVSWSQLRTSGHARHAQRFSDQCMARGVAEVYREVLSQ